MLKTYLAPLLKLISQLVTYFSNKRLIDLGAKEAELEWTKENDTLTTSIKSAQSDGRVRDAVREEYQRD